jgi:RNA polymerase sigma-54 factor
LDYSAYFTPIRSQKLLLTPQLKQAIDLLEMNSLELQNYIEQQIEGNPALDHVAERNDYDFRSEIREEENDQPTIEDIQQSLTLREHLLLQLNSTCISKEEHSIGEYLIYNTDDNGYLTVDTKEVSAFFGIDEDRVSSVLRRLQTFDPPGICARDLKECLRLQLLQMKDTDEDVLLITEKCLDELADDDLQTASCKTGIPVDRIRDIFAKIRSLEPRPGREFYRNETERVLPPDIIVRESNDGYRIICNDDAFPDVCLSEYFSDMLSYDDDLSMKEKTDSAVWLIKCLEQREDIIVSIAKKLCLLEEEFLTSGIKKIRLLNKDTFAASLNMHVSILEKAVKGKYLKCRWGVYELSRFFTDGSLE